MWQDDLEKRNPDVNRAIENLIVENCTVKNIFPMKDLFQPPDNHAAY